MIVLDGELYSDDVPLLTGQNRAFRYGEAVFESMAMFNGKVPLLPYHLERLAKGMAAIHLPQIDKINELIPRYLQILPLKKEKKVRIRLQVFRKDGGLYTPTQEACSVLIEASVVEAAPERWWNEPIHLSFSSQTLPNHALMQHKLSSNSIWYVLGAIEARDKGVDDVVFRDVNRHLVDCTKGNLCWIIDGQLYSTAAELPAVKGVFRNYIFEKAAVMGISSKLVYLWMLDLAREADAIFVCNAVNGIYPVTKIGPITKPTEPVRDLWEVLFGK